MSQASSSPYPPTPAAMATIHHKLSERTTAIRSAQTGLTAIFVALAEINNEADRHNVTDHGEDIVYSRVHPGGWMICVQLLFGSMPFLQVRAPEDNQVLVQELRQLLTNPRRGLEASIECDRPDLPRDSIWIWLGQ